MTRRGVRWLSAGLLLGTGAGLLDTASALNPAVAAADDTALLMGYAASPNPLPQYVTDVMRLFISPDPPLFEGQPTFDGYTPEIQPVELGANYQLVLTEGVKQLDDGIRARLLDPDDRVVVFGYSESSSIATQEMINLGELDPADRPGADQLSFVLFENLNNPNGGYLERLPFLAGLPFPATPADTPYDTAVYSIEYSGSSDFPQYPLNFLATANATAGFLNLHTAFLPGWPTTFDPSSIEDAVLQPTSDAAQNIDYYLIPTQNLPILDGLRALPVVGKPLAEMMQPAMRVLIDLGYDRTGDADVSTPAEWLAMSPDVNWDTVMDNLQLGMQQGMIASQVSLGLLPESELPNLYPYLPDIAGLQAGANIGSDAAAAISAAADDDVTSWLTTGFTSLFGDNLAESLTTLLTNPLDFFDL